MKSAYKRIHRPGAAATATCVRSFVCISMRVFFRVKVRSSAGSAGPGRPIPGKVQGSSSSSRVFERSWDDDASSSRGTAVGERR